MKKMLSLLLTLCLLLGVLPTQALAYVGDILPAGSATVEQITLDDGSLSLQNKYIHVTLRKLWGSYAYITVVPAAKTDEESMWVSQTPYCNFITYDQRKEQTEGVVLTPEKVEFVTGTPNDLNARAIKVEYSLLTAISLVTAKATVYYELVQLKEDVSSTDDTWGVLASVSEILVDEESMPKDWNRDFAFKWGYAINNFTATGHISNLEKSGGPAIKMSRTTVPYVGEGEPLTITTESSVFTAPVENLNTKTVPKGYSEWGDVDGVYITEVYTDGYPWANPFVGLSDYYEKEITSSGGSPIRVALAQTVNVKPGDMPLDTYVMCESYAGFTYDETSGSEEFSHFLWGFHGLMKAGEESVPSEPDKVNISINAKRLAAFASGSGVTVEYVADDAALEALKRQYGNPVALISGDYESKNGAEFTFTGGAALLSPSVTATWNKNNGGKLVIKKDGTIEQSGVSLNAPTFKFYQPNDKSGKDLEITLTQDGFTFEIAPDKNDAVVFVDIPYATVKLESASADVAGNLVFSGNIGFQTLFSGAEFSMEKLGYGLTEKTVNGEKTYEFKVNGVHAKGKFDTEKLMTLELAKIEGEVNTFKGEERYAFELELNVFDLFETEASLALERSKKDGSLIPDELWFYVKADPGIPLVPPIPIGQLNGGGAGFKDLAATVNGDYFAIPPLKLRGALTGTYLHLIQGTGNVVLGPSEISLKATDVGIVGLGEGAQLIESFGYSLQLSGQDRSYNGEDYKGIYFVGSEELELNLPSKKIDIFVLDTAIKLGAFGGVNNNKDTVYLGIGANGIVNGTIQIPSNLGIPFIGGLKLASTDINLIVGGQTTFNIEGVSVSEGMKQAFNNVDVYLGAMTGVNVGIVDARVWVLVPQIIDTNFRKGGGWDIETKWLGKLPEWDWSEKGVEPVVQAMSLEDGEENTVVLLAAEPLALGNGSGENLQTIEVTANEGETPYILLAFDRAVTERQIKENLSITKQNEANAADIYWVGDDCEINSTYKINADTAIMKHEDGNEYRVALLRLKDGGTYQVNTGSLAIRKSQNATIMPFESLDLNLNNNQVSGQIKYAETGTKYVLRTYLGTELGGADYLIDEQEITNPSNISIDIPTNGTLAPTGNYYVTSFLMTEKTTTVKDENGNSKKVTALAAIDNQQFNSPINYTNTEQPEAPTNVSLTFTGNEVMRASWDTVTDANGYAVTIYQKSGSNWIDTGFGYDVDESITSINMALTVGGEETKESKNLSANETYKVGVRAYKLIPTGLEEENTTVGGEEPKNTSTAGENAVNPNKAFKGAKYYSEEKQSTGLLLPEYTPLKMTLKVNETTCVADENGVYHAYVGGGSLLVVTCADADSITVTRMDTDTFLTEDGSGGNIFAIPDFTGTLMLRVDGKKDKDTTSVFLLVSVDKTPPVLTLSDPIFFADKATGEYTVTGTADAGSQIVYGDNESVYAASDGSFAISGTLESNSGILSLYAQDSAGNQSAPQLALITKQTKYSVTVSGSYAQSPGTGRYAENSTVTVRAGTRSGYTFSGWTSDDGVTFDNAGAAETIFTMPGKDVTVTANWVSSGGSSSSSSASTYPVSTPDKIENGSVTVSPKNASRGDTVTITVKPDDGFKLGDLTVTDKNGNELTLTDKGDGKYTFTMPSGRVEVKATFVEEVKASPFDDVATNAYYYEAVKWAQEKGITGGIGNNLFGPNQPCTRAQIVTFLWRAVGSPEPKDNAAGMTDVAAGSYYEKAVAWAIENGITTGTGGGKFSPDETCTRAQAVTFLARALNAKADSKAEFSDVPTNSYFADAVAWAAANGVTTGISGGLFGPDDDCTRAQIVAFLYRAYNR